MARLAFDSDGEQEFPDLAVINMDSKQQKLDSPFASQDADKENAPLQASALKTPRASLKQTSIPVSLSKGTPLRRRKLLGSSQLLDSGLSRKWNDGTVFEVGEEEPSPRKARAPTMRALVTAMKATETSESSFGESVTILSDSDDEDVIVPRGRRRVKLQPARSASVMSRQTSAAQRSFFDDLDTTKQSFDSSAVSSIKPDSDSSFGTAVSFASNSDSSYSFVNSSQEDAAPKTPSKPKPAQRVPATAPAKRNVNSSILTIGESSMGDLWDKKSIIPETPRSRPRKDPITARKANDLEDAFKKLKILTEELEDVSDGGLPISLKFDPVTPRKTLKSSPSKAPRIPLSPHKPHQNEFWDAEIQNAWMDKHSPRKPSTTKSIFAAKDDKISLKEKYGTSPEKRDARKAFDEKKDLVAQSFLLELDERVTEGKLGELTAATGGMRIQWSATLQSTAGRAHWKCKETTTTKQQPDGTSLSTKERQHHASIELASKVLTNEDDLLNTVAHEFCHLAVFMLNGKVKSAHGAEFKAWGRKVMDVLGAGRGIVVTTKHNYEIEYKYIWRCVECTTEVQRHSKSVDPSRQRCGRCKGVLEQVKPVPRSNAGKGKSAYQEFVSTEMKALKAEGKEMTFKEMMGVVSSRWKLKQAQAKEKSATAAAAAAAAAVVSDEQEKKVAKEEEEEEEDEEIAEATAEVENTVITAEEEDKEIIEEDEVDLITAQLETLVVAAEAVSE